MVVRSSLLVGNSELGKACLCWDSRFMRRERRERSREAGRRKRKEHGEEVHQAMCHA